MKNILFLFFFPFALSAQDNTAIFESYMKGQAGQYNFNGNVLVSKNGKVIYERSFGYADYNSKKAPGRLTAFLMLALLQRNLLQWAYCC